MTSLWHNFRGSVFANSSCCLLISVSEVHWRVCCQIERQIQQDARGSAHNACASQQCLYKNCMKTVHKWLKKNSGCLITLQIWISWRCFWGKDAQSYFETFIQSQKQILNSTLHQRRYGTISAGAINKAPRVLEIVWQEYMKGNGRHSEHFSVLKSVHNCQKLF